MMNEQTKSVLKYTLLPQVLPRFKELFATGFAYIPYFIALTFQLVRLLPANHPYLNPDNFGNYGIRHVLAAASNNLVLSRKNIDQIIIYILILAGVVMAFVQIALLLLGVFISPSLAIGLPDNPLTDEETASGIFTITQMFNVPEPGQDFAYMMLDMVFGVTKQVGENTIGFFESCIATQDCVDVYGTAPAGNDLLNQQAFPYPTHLALHALFGFYSSGLLIVAMLITIYFLVTIVAETAQTGTPFGKRFNKVWAPLRLVVAIGLLIPMSSGLNSSQYIVLYAAKFGSAFASNGWAKFSEQIFSADGAYDSEEVEGLAQGQRFVTGPRPPRLNGLLQFLYTARICAEAWAMEKQVTDEHINVYVIKGSGFATDTNHYQLVNASHYSDTNREGSAPGFGALSEGDNSYEKLIEHADGSHYLTIRFGIKDEGENSAFIGNINPVCGELSFNLIDPRPSSIEGSEMPVDANGEPIPAEVFFANPGAEIIQRAYWAILKHAWFNAFYLDPFTKQPYALYEYCSMASKDTCRGVDKDVFEALNYEQKYLVQLVNKYKLILAKATWDPTATVEVENAASDDDVSAIPGIGEEGAIMEQEAALKRSFSENLQKKGWGGAAIWYNKVAEMNGFLASAMFNAPTIVTYPLYMEEVLKFKNEVETKINPLERFKPEVANPLVDVSFLFPDYWQYEAAFAMYNGFDLWNSADTEIYSKGNTFESIVTAIFGLEGLFSMRDNDGVHPIAQLTTVGRSLIQAAILNVLGAGATPLMAFVAGEGVANAAMSLLMTVGTITLTLGFVLFYVVPFLPFIYFFFALGGWVKGVFEAMVGAPLWALAHIRIDGEGLPGQAAVAGYFLILEIFLRPILIVFGLVASILIFSALVNVLNEVWDVAVSNVGGSGGRSATDTFTALLNELGVDTGDENVSDWARAPIDTFFYTVMYTVVVYMMGMSSFKLIDLIPNNILRWMGQSIQTFNDSREDAAQKLSGTAYIGGQQSISGVTDGVKGIMQKANNAAGGQGKG